MKDEQIKQLREALRRAVDEVERLRSDLSGIDKALTADLYSNSPKIKPLRLICTVYDRTNGPYGEIIELHEFVDPGLAILTYRQILSRTEYDGRNISASLCLGGDNAHNPPRYESDFSFPFGMGRITPDDPRLTTERGRISAYNVSWSLPKPKKSRRKTTDPEA